MHFESIGTQPIQGNPLLLYPMSEGLRVIAVFGDWTSSSGFQHSIYDLERGSVSDLPVPSHYFLLSFNGRDDFYFKDTQSSHLIRMRQDLQRIWEID